MYKENTAAPNKRRGGHSEDHNKLIHSLSHTRTTMDPSPTLHTPPTNYYFNGTSDAIAAAAARDLMTTLSCGTLDDETQLMTL